MTTIAPFIVIIIVTQSNVSFVIMRWIMDDLRFGVYEHKLVYDTDKIIKRQLIVLKDEDGKVDLLR